MRLPDWQARFWANIDAARQTPFQWGTHDCVMWATSSIDAVLGTDYVAQARIQYPYASEDEAAALMAQYGGITGLVQSFLGDPVNWGQLSMGDVVLVGPIPQVTATEMLCVHDGVQLLGTAAKGVLEAPLAYAVHGWKIE